MLATIDDVIGKEYDYIICGMCIQLRGSIVSEMFSRWRRRLEDSSATYGLTSTLQTSGLVLASRLTEDPSISVLVVEAGEANLDDPVLRKSYQLFFFQCSQCTVRTASYGRHFGNPSYDWVSLSDTFICECVTDGSIGAQDGPYRYHETMWFMRSAVVCRFLRRMSWIANSSGLGKGLTSLHVFDSDLVSAAKDLAAVRESTSIYTQSPLPTS
jgi:hypothetical protein